MTKSTYRLVYRLTAPMIVVDILRTRWIQITRSRCHVSDMFEKKGNADQMVECRSVEHGIRVQIGKYSASWLVRVNKSIEKRETVSSAEYAVAK
jgi:hypothetical protein